VVYVDDSGTDSKSAIVTAAFCVSTERKWQEFEARWRKIGERAGFEHFHMTEFAACKRDKWCPQCRHGKTTALDHPWRAWSPSKRENVLNRLAKAVVSYSECAFGMAHTKQDYDDHVRNSPARQVSTEPISDEQFTFALQQCGGELAKWRAANAVTKPLKFVFDLTSSKEERREIAKVFLASVQGRSQLKDCVERWFTPKEVLFASRKQVLPLLAADMLAWTIASIRSRDVFRCGEFNEAYGVGLIFTGTKHIRMGYMEKETLKRWERDTLSGRAVGEGVYDRNALRRM
jgi:hypothetical protein